MDQDYLGNLKQVALRCALRVRQRLQLRHQAPQGALTLVDRHHDGDSMGSRECFVLRSMIEGFRARTVFSWRRNRSHRTRSEYTEAPMGCRLATNRRATSDMAAQTPQTNTRAPRSTSAA